MIAPSEQLLVLSKRGVRTGVIGHYGLFDEHPTLEAAIAAARDKLASGSALAFVAIRIEAAYAHDKATRIGDGIECELARFEVYPDRVVLVPGAQGGLTDEQKAAAHALSKKEWRLL